MSETVVIVNVLGNPYKVSCPEERVDDLRIAANYLENRIREITEETRLGDRNRVLTMVALNLCDELLSGGGEATSPVEEQQILRRMHKKLDQVLKLPATG